LEFVINNVGILGDDPHLINIAVIAARGLATAGYRGSVDSLLTVFSGFRDTLVRVEVINSLVLLSRENDRVTAVLNQFLADQNKLRRSRMNVDFTLVTACVSALSKLGDSSSFSPLFEVLTTDYPEELKAEAKTVMLSLQGDFKQFLIEVLRKNSPSEKLFAFRFGNNNSRLIPVEQGQLAESAMEQALSHIPANMGEEAQLSDLGHEASLCLSRLQWTRASSLVIRYYYRLHSDYQKGIVPKERCIQAIACLGAMGTSEAAAAAGLQLGLINAQTEKSGAYDADITLALVRTLGLIGDKSAFDHLLYISYLPYNDEIETAAREALDRLRW
jgi:HEAT repeat protein